MILNISTGIKNFLDDEPLSNWMEYGPWNIAKKCVLT